MVSKAQIKFIRLLHQKKYRAAHGLFIAEGSKIAFDILKSRLKVHKIYATARWLSQNSANLPSGADTEAVEITETEMEKISALESAQEVLLLVEIPENGLQIDTKALFLLAVEGIRDPGNLGTMVRVCDWYGIGQMFCSEDCADLYSPKTIRATMGSIGRVQVSYTDLQALVRELKGRISLAATLDGNINVHEAHLDGQPVLLVIGNEGHGLSPELTALCSDTIAIPRFGGAESLNASVAAAVLVDNLKRVGGQGRGSVPFD